MKESDRFLATARGARAGGASACAGSRSCAREPAARAAVGCRDMSHVKAELLFRRPCTAQGKCPMTPPPHDLPDSRRGALDPRGLLGGELAPPRASRHRRRRRERAGPGYAQLQYSSFERPSRPFQLAELSYQRPAAGPGPLARAPPRRGAAGGPPTPTPPVPVEGFIRAQLTARLGPWEPAVGPEIGFSGLAHLATNNHLPLEEIYHQATALLGPRLPVLHRRAPALRVSGLFRASAAGGPPGDRRVSVRHGRPASS